MNELAEVLKGHGWDFTNDCFFNSLRPDVTGIAITVTPELRDKITGKPLADDNYPPNLRTLAMILDAAKLPARWGVYDDKSKQDHFWLIIGNAP